MGKVEAPRVGFGTEASPDRGSGADIPRPDDRTDVREIERLKQAHAQTMDGLRASAARFDTVVRKTAGASVGSFLLPPPAQAILQALKAYHTDTHALVKTAAPLPRGADIEDCAACLGVHLQPIILPAEWWRADHGHLVGFMSEESGDGGENDASRAVALIARGGGYTACDPQSGRTIQITGAEAERIRTKAFAVYPPLPDQMRGLSELFSYLMAMVRPECIAAVLAGFIIGAIATIVPIAIALVVDTLVPGNERMLLMQVGVALAVGAMLTFFFSLMRQQAVLRVSGRTALSLDAAIWSKLLKLPTDFFVTYSIGDLQQRISGISAVRAALVNVTFATVIAFIMSVFYLGLLFYYDSRLALLAAALIMVLSAFTLIIGVAQLRHRRRQIELSGWLSGYVFQILQGIIKLRVAAAEDRAVMRWADRYADEREAILRVRRLGNHFNAFADAYGTLAMAAIFVAIRYMADSRFSAGVFIAFVSAFGGLQAAYQALAMAALEIIAVLPDWERAKPILAAEPEAPVLAADPGVLTGEIELTGVDYAYGDGPAVLRDISLSIRAGEHLAIVGPSGSGKSTLVRVLLGMARPQSGTVLYDGQDLAGLDPTKVRRQIGVVTQTGRLYSGTIMDNVRGATNASFDKCMAACRSAGLEADLEQFPMGLHTPLTEGAPTFSGGQRQRILIARALVNRPRILIFDEATSALDNAAQAIVTESLDRLGATRIVIAHRLSTVQNANRICVMQDGRIVDQGTFEGLTARGGLFAELVRRQLA